MHATQVVRIAGLAWGGDENTISLDQEKNLQN